MLVMSMALRLEEIEAGLQEGCDEAWRWRTSARVGAVLWPGVERVDFASSVLVVAFMLMPSPLSFFSSSPNTLCPSFTLCRNTYIKHTHTASTQICLDYQRWNKDCTPLVINHVVSLPPVLHGTIFLICLSAEWMSGMFICAGFHLADCTLSTMPYWSGHLRPQTLFLCSLPHAWSLEGLLDFIALLWPEMNIIWGLCV